MADVEAKIEREYKAGAGPKALSEKYGVSVDTIKSWIKRRKWKRGAPSDEDAPFDVAGVHPDERGKESQKGRPKSAPAPPRRQPATKQTTSRGGAPVGNRNAAGHGAPRGNSNAVTHGFYRRYFPDDEETQTLLEEVEELSAADMLWINIKTQFTAIIRAQKIMFVADQDDMTKEVRRTKRMSSEAMEIDEEEYEIQFAWDKHAKYLTAQARAMSELRSLIKDFLAITGDDDERRLKIERMEQSLNLDRERFEHQKKMDELRADMALYKLLPKDDDGEEIEGDGFDDAGGEKPAQEVWEGYDTPTES